MKSILVSCIDDWSPVIRIQYLDVLFRVTAFSCILRWKVKPLFYPSLAELSLYILIIWQMDSVLWEVKSDSYMRIEILPIDKWVKITFWVQTKIDRKQCFNTWNTSRHEERRLYEEHTVVFHMRKSF